jgi:hypothetical protein
MLSERVECINQSMNTAVTSDSEKKKMRLPDIVLFDNHIHTFANFMGVSKSMYRYIFSTFFMTKREIFFAGDYSLACPIL